MKYRLMRKERDKDKLIEQRKRDRDKSRFSGNRLVVLERDNYECQMCGMQQEQHIVLFGSSLLIHHKDGNGRDRENPNNNINNLITLCFRCHQTAHKILRDSTKTKSVKK
jgi:5-methylcytosine-specific restriction endonuclease McrA